jgi:hypothetical protein
MGVLQMLRRRKPGGLTIGFIVGIVMFFALAAIFGLSNDSGEDQVAEREPEAVEIELSEAAHRHLLEYSASGVGSIDRISLRLTSKSEDDLNVQVLPGTMFEPTSASVQNMVVTSSRSILLPSYETVGPIDIKVACANMELEAPGEDHNLTLRSGVTSSDLIKILGLSEFQSETTRVKQFAIWTITDNPERGKYMRIATGASIFGKGPTDEEMGKIRLLFEKAGISTARYQALR